MSLIAETWNLPITPTKLTDLGKWRRGGAETYIAEGEILSADGQSHHVIGKAFVGWGLSPIAQQERWEDRRSRFSGAGIRVPALYARYPALSVEEFIPETLTYDCLRTSDCLQLGIIARILIQLNLQPQALLSDVRRTAAELVYIDFGTDLAVLSDIHWPDAVANRLSSENRQAFVSGLFGNQHYH